MMTKEIMMKTKLHAGHYSSFRTDYSNPVDLPIPLVLSIVTPLSKNCDSISSLFPTYAPSTDTLISSSESTTNIYLFFKHNILHPNFMTNHQCIGQFIYYSTFI